VTLVAASNDVREAVQRVKHARELLRLASLGNPYPAYRLKRTITPVLTATRQQRMRVRHRNLVLARRYYSAALLASFDAFNAREAEIARIIRETGNDDLAEYFDVAGKRTVSIYSPTAVPDGDGEPIDYIALGDDAYTTSLMLPTDGAVYRKPHTLKRAPKSRRFHRRGPLVMTRHEDERAIVREYGEMFPNLVRALTVTYWRETALGDTPARASFAIRYAGSRHDKASRDATRVDRRNNSRMAGLQRLLALNERRKAENEQANRERDALKLRMMVAIETPAEAYERNR
jgi:hypothetical protein